MHFRAFKFQRQLIYLVAAVLYPVFAYLSSGNSLLKLIDALTVTGFVFLIFGVVYSMIRHGDFDITEYVARRSVRRGDVKPFKAFKADKNEERKNSFNYPFFTSLLLLAAAAVLTIFVY